MERIINLGGTDVKVKASGLTPLLYRRMFGREMLTTIHKAVSKEGEVLDLEVFENLAYIIAKQGGSIPEGVSIEEWLDGFDSPMVIIDAIGPIMDTWNASAKTTVKRKKKADQLTET